MRTRIFKIREWDKYEELAKKEYAFRLSKGAYIPDYEEFKRKMIAGDIVEDEVAAALLLRDDIYNLQWLDPHHGWLTHSDEPIYGFKPDITFEMNSKTVVADIKKSCNNIIKGAVPPKWYTDKYDFIRTKVFHGADILLTLNEKGELRVAYLNDYFGTNNSGNTLFHTHSFEEFNYVQTTKER